MDLSAALSFSAVAVISIWAVLFVPSWFAGWRERRQWEGLERRRSRQYAQVERRRAD